jgi:uncharacterized glyoxalase superfamily protein PhnB
MSAPIDFHTISPQFAVADVIKAAEYYRDFLGFEILGYWLDPPVYAIIRRGSVEIHFGLADNSNNPQRSNREHRKEGLDLYVRINGIEALHDELKEKHVKIIQPVCAQEYGMLEFVIEDCHGFKIAFGQNNP